jgi:dTDP-glucose 4,6-dehydratase
VINLAEAVNRFLVTGGAGFIGSAVCRYLVGECQAEVLNVDKLTYAANLQSLASIAKNPRYRFVQADIADHGKISALLRDFKPDAIFHLAAETHVDRSIDCAAPFMQTNVIGTYTMLDAVRAYWHELQSGRRHQFRFLLVSTDEVYGSLGKQDPAFNEQTPYDPSSPYAASKASADHLASAWHRTYGLPVIISNCSNNFGPYQFPEKLIPLSILNAMDGLPIRVYGNGENVRDWLFVEDHAHALVEIMRRGKPGEKYNVGARNERSNLSVVELVCDLVDEFRPSSAKRRSLITFVTDRPGHDFRYAIDPLKVERELAWRTHETFEAALRRTVSWYLENPSWWQPLRQNVYSGERLGMV